MRKVSQISALGTADQIADQGSSEAHISSSQREFAMARTPYRAPVAETILAPDYISQAYLECYLKPHMRRFEFTTTLLQAVATPEMRVIDVASYGSLVPILRDLFAISDITVTQPFEDNCKSSEDCGLPQARQGARYPVHIDRFDIEERFPYPDQSFDLVLFTEVLEHLAYDPVHTLSELNRITKENGWLLLSTPNCASTKSVLKVLLGRNPNFFPAYNKRRSLDRHNREYTPREVQALMGVTGFEVREFRTVNVYDEKLTFTLWAIETMLTLGWFCSLGTIRRHERGDTTFALCQKSGGVRERYPAFLYA